MISIIVCSVKADAFFLFSENVSKTVGVPFEIIRIDNSNNKHSICSAYNEGARSARFEYLCFSHEDILIHTQDWGFQVISAFLENKLLGLIGIAGSKHRTLTPSTWSSFNGSNYINIIQHYKYKNLEPEVSLHNPTNEKIASVVCIDGAWFCTPKAVWTEVGFDEKTFKGFHCYDIDFSLSVLMKYQVGVIFSILLEHFSDGNYKKDWIFETLKLHKKWRQKLPITRLSLTKMEIQNKELGAMDKFLHLMLEQRCHPAEMSRVYKFVSKNMDFSFKNKLMFLSRLIRQYLKYYLGYNSGGPGSKGSLTTIKND